VHPIEPVAREAFAAGWATSGGPMTERVKTACSAAVDLAVEHADHPRILEVTIDLGRLEGLWAKLYERREQLIRSHIGTIAELWRNALAGGLIADAIRRLRQSDTGAGDRQETEAIAAAALAALPNRPDWLPLRQAMRDALAAGQAEGATSAKATAADRSGGEQPDWDAEFATHHGTLATQTALWSDADTWLQRLLARAATALGRALHQPDASDDELAAAADQSVDKPVASTTDWAVTTAIGAGALAWYQQNRSTSIDWIDAGDGRVCAACQTNADNSPYAPADFPPLPDHPGCRCIASAST